MLTSFHSAASVVVGTAITHVTGSEALGLGVVFLLHYPTDYLGENASEGYQAWEVVFHSLLLIFGLVYNYWAMVLAYAFSGNLMDIIDKKGYLAILFPKKYSYMFIFHKRGRKLLQLSKEITHRITLGLVAGLIILITIKLLLK